MKIDFFEKQRMPLWVHLVMLVVFAFVCYDAIVNHNLTALRSVILIFSLLIIVVVEVLLILFSMKTVINNDGIFVKMLPMLKYKHFDWDDIEKAYIRKYKPLMEYGGWGYRLNVGKNRIGIKTFSNIGSAYNVRGNIGLQLEFKNGKKVLIGTQKRAEIEQILKIAKEEKLLQ